jgi:hypothetical protein
MTNTSPIAVLRGVNPAKIIPHHPVTIAVVAGSPKPIRIVEVRCANPLCHHPLKVMSEERAEDFRYCVVCQKAAWMPAGA